MKSHNRRLGISFAFGKYNKTISLFYTFPKDREVLIHIL